MNQWLSLTRRELSSYFSSFMGYFILLGFLFLGGLISWFCLMYYQKPTMRYFFDFASFLLIFLAPILTMRSFAEERRLRTLEMLMTTRILDAELVIAKFLGAWLFYVLLILPSISYYWILSYYAPPDSGEVFSGYLGNLLLAAFYIAIGLFFSSLTQNQIVSALFGITTIFSLNLFSAFEQRCFSMCEDVILFLKSLFPSLWIELILNYSLMLVNTIIESIAIQNHIRTFYQGIFDTRELVYFLSLIVFFLFLTTKAVERQRWKT
ncbi:MAG: ABC transporter permease subunit [Planctomycetota bacterium]